MKQDSCWPKGSLSGTSEVIDCREDCCAGRIWYSYRHWSLVQGQATVTVKIKQRSPENHRRNISNLHIVNIRVWRVGF